MVAASHIVLALLAVAITWAGTAVLIRVAMRQRLAGESNHQPRNSFGDLPVVPTVSTPFHAHHVADGAQHDHA